MQKKRKGYLWGFVFALLCSLVIALPALAADEAGDSLGIMPMGLTGKVQWTDQKLVTAGDVKVFIGTKEVGGGAITPEGMFGVLAGKDSEDNGKKLSFVVVTAGKEYPAVSLPEEIICAEGSLQDEIVLAIERDKTPGGGGGGGSGGGIAAPSKPLAAPYGGTYKKSIEVSLANTTAGAVIYYTTDGSNPKDSATRQEYKAPFKVETTTAVKAVSYKNDLYSDVLISAYTISGTEASEPGGATGPPAEGDVSPPAGDTGGFADLKGHWAAQTVQELVGKGIISGYEDNAFRPDNLINRAECSAILARALQLPAGAATLDAFGDAADVPAWAKAPVAAAVEAALLKGYPEGDGTTTFRPARQVTRAELAVILSRVVVKELGEQHPAAPKFTDSGKIPAWALDGVSLAAGKGLVQGYPDGTFQPDKEVTRAEAAAMIARLLGVLKA
ncbi:MAG: Cellulosome-anchoring protein precursor [Firmicutes bacterium ADurb.Bin456]|nr:MAG: Cellulosome-anchoring protein precursor [Firmicutes bacterium ADurb.Bin456]